LPRVISRDEFDSDARSPVALNLRDIEQQARGAVEQARAEAKRILSDALARAREMERVGAARGEKAGLEAGRAEGAEAGRAEALEAETRRIQDATATVREALVDMVGEIETHRHELLAGAKQGLLHLSVAIAERICRAQIARSDEHLRPLVEEVIETAGRQGGLVLRANPADVKAIETFLGDVHAPVTAGDAGIRLVSDETVEAGGCVAERAAGTVDGRVETQLERIVAELMGVDAADGNESGETP